MDPQTLVDFRNTITDFFASHNVPIVAAVGMLESVKMDLLMWIITESQNARSEENSGTGTESNDNSGNNS